MWGLMLNHVNHVKSCKKEWLKLKKKKRWEDFYEKKVKYKWGAVKVIFFFFERSLTFCVKYLDTKLKEDKINTKPLL